MQRFSMEESFGKSLNVENPLAPNLLRFLSKTFSALTPKNSGFFVDFLSATNKQVNRKLKKLELRLLRSSSRRRFHTSFYWARDDEEYVQMDVSSRFFVGP